MIKPIVLASNPAPVGEIVEILEEALNLAKSGLLISVAITGEISGRKCYDGLIISAGADKYTLLGAITRVSEKCQRAMDEDE